MPIISLRTPDPEYAESFRAYLNYVEDLAGSIGGIYGVASSLVEGVHDGVLLHPPVARMRRKQLDDDRSATVKQALRKAWSHTYRMAVEVGDAALFDEEANAWIPTQAYYAVYHALLAYAAASHQSIPNNHRAGLNFASELVSSGRLPYPWSACCTGGPETADISYAGFKSTISRVHVLTTPDPQTTEDRLAMFLRTTRQKELERRFAEARQRKPAPGRSRRNLSRAEKAKLAADMKPTSMFDILWRLRKKANYDDADVFVLGAAHEHDARRLGSGLAILTDATVAALEALIAARIGADEMWTMIDGYRRKRRERAASTLDLRATSWARYLPAASVP